MNKFQPAVTLLTAFLSAMVVACGRSPAAPTAEGAPAIATLVLRGHVVDDLDKPVAGATVTVERTGMAELASPVHATTDGNGAFALSAALRVEWQTEVPIKIDRDGYEGTETSIAQNSDATITIYQTTKIVAGSTLSARIVATAPYACGFESHRCRRIVVEPAGEPVAVEIVKIDGEDAGLTDDEPPLTPFDYEHRVVVTDGELFIIGGPATVTLRARRYTDSLLGQYTLTLTHGCTEVPEAARTRTYTASIDAAATGFVVTLSDAEFLWGGICEATASHLGCHQFLASREEDRVRFDLINADEWHGGYITERVPSGNWLQVFGSAVGRVEGGAITATGSGGIWYCTRDQTNPFPCNSVVSCDVTDLRLRFTRR